VERVDWLPKEQMRVNMPEFSGHLRRDVGSLLLVRRRGLRRVRGEVHGLRVVRLQLVVPLGRWML